MSKSNPGVEDLLCDETFLSWYFKTDVRSIKQWEQWIADNPGSSHRVQQAVDFLSSLTLKEEVFTREQLTWSEKTMLEKIRLAGRKPFASVIPLSKKAWVAAAACFVLIAGAAGLYSIQKGQKSEYHTAYGEIKTGSLPDGTEVMVNAGSRVRYSSGWTDGKDREVWLSGEAYFHVTRTPLKSRFIVHASHFDVIVTGTQFNVISRGQKENVLLQEGSVTLHTADGEDMTMLPGDFVEYTGHGLAKKTVRADGVTAWKEHKLSFDSTSLKDVAGIIKEQYGVAVRLADEAVGNKTVSGIMPNDNLDVLLQSLEATTEFKVIRHDGEIIIQN